MKKIFGAMLAVCLLLGGCTAPEAKVTTASTGSETIHYTAQVREPRADGLVVYETETSSLDASHAQDGYVMASYSGDCEKVKLLITTPAGNVYQYHMNPGKGYEAFPLTEGAGEYTFATYENVVGEQYAPDLSQMVRLDSVDEFGCYLYPSQYVDFSSDSAVVKKAEEIGGTAADDLELLGRVYDYVVENLTYDNEKAAIVQSGYVPDPDEVLRTGKGICFDYAAVMASMLRCLGVPTQLQVGYFGTLYHAWISTHIQGVGWVNGVIQFDGETWQLMDPTTAASKGDKVTAEFLKTDGAYTAKYKY